MKVHRLKTESFVETQKGLLKAGFPPNDILKNCGREIIALSDLHESTEGRKKAIAEVVEFVGELNRKLKGA